MSNQILYEVDKHALKQSSPLIYSSNEVFYLILLIVSQFFNFLKKLINTVVKICKKRVHYFFIYIFLETCNASSIQAEIICYNLTNVHVCIYKSMYNIIMF